VQVSRIVICTLPAKNYIKHPMHDFSGQIIRLGNIKIPGAQDLTADDKKLFLER
jgi:hypothetical protein